MIKIEFEKLVFGATFYDPRTHAKWVKYDEEGAIMEEDKNDTIGAFRPDEIIWVF